MKIVTLRKKVIAQIRLTAFLIAVLLAASYSTSQAQGITPDHIAKLKTVTSSTISDNGNFVAYTLSVPADPFAENARNATHLYVLNTTSGESKPYFTSANVSQVQFRPSKGTVTFLAKLPKDDTNAIYELNLSGGEATKLFAHSTHILNYSWQADGNRVAFSISEKAETPKTPLTYAPDFYEERFSQRKGFIVNLSENDAQPRPLNVKGSVYRMVWSPDGAKIAVSAAPTSSVDDSFMKQKIVIVSSSNQNVIATVDNEGKLGEIVWSPDGSRIAIRAG